MRISDWSSDVCSSDLSDEENALIADELLPGNRSEADLVEAASNLLSEMSQMAGVVTVPRRNLAVLRRIEFLPLSGNRVLAILVVNQHEVQNSIISTERPYGAAELARYANLVNEHFAGRDLVNLRQALLHEAADAPAPVNPLPRKPD